MNKFFNCRTPFLGAETQFGDGHPATETDLNLGPVSVRVAEDFFWNVKTWDAEVKIKGKVKRYTTGVEKTVTLQYEAVVDVPWESRFHPLGGVANELPVITFSLDGGESGQTQGRFIMRLFRLIRRDDNGRFFLSHRNSLISDEGVNLFGETGYGAGDPVSTQKGEVSFGTEDDEKLDVTHLLDSHISEAELKLEPNEYWDESNGGWDISAP